MSRSYKKTPVYKDNRSSKFGKKVANRKVRRHKGGIADGKAYRKIYESWNISDFSSYYSKEMNRSEQEAKEKANLNGVIAARFRHKATLSNNDWRKYYLSK